MEKDWAQKLAAKMEAIGDDDAIRAFCAAYANGDSVEAWVKFSAAAERRIEFGNYTLLIFADDSCYASWQENEDCFYPDVSDLADADPDVREALDADNP